ncbi:MAG: tRNA(Ile2)-agmatinylcytidine synthase [Candidatus Thalassarchaeaceae archaeon]|jgi:tRNA(Ile2)-agmatinylcytidine synthase
MDNIRFFVGIDDTDHLEEGCTTDKMNNFINHIINNISITISERRLVRLWPFASRRTRGNAALSAILEIHKEDEKIFFDLSADWFKNLLLEISKHPPSEIPASPALIISKSVLSEDFYWETVTGHVDINTRLIEIEKYNCKIYTGKNNWGIIGASAAIAWIPNKNSTWELIAWRKPTMIGQKRILDLKKVTDLDSRFLDTFLNRDPTKNRGLISPRTPCPVLYGIRGSSYATLKKAHIWLQSNLDFEQCSDYKIHRTNQLSDDHVSPLNGTVVSKISISKGAHSSLSVFSNGRNITLIAFNEGGPVNKLLRSLVPGDMISWTGLFSPIDNSIHLEKLSLYDSVPRILHRPLCCYTSMKSAGNQQSLRCSKCNNKSIKYWVAKDVVTNHIKMVNNWAEPSPSNRRHLSKPLEFEIPLLNNLIS